MARVNSGVSPALLSDQHLVAESVEITMIVGSLRLNKYEIKGNVPDKYTLGKGHINFFKDKLVYLQKRLREVNDEMIRRGFKPGTKLDLDEFPDKYKNDWTPNLEDTMQLRLRITDRLQNPRSGRKDLHRYKGASLLEQMELFKDSILKSELYYV